MIGQKVPLQRLAGALSEVVDGPVVDRTGLTGTFDVDLRWTPDGYRFAAGQGEDRSAGVLPEAGASIMAAVQEQLGLKLTPTKGPVEVLVVDSAAKPSGN